MVGGGGRVEGREEEEVLCGVASEVGIVGRGVSGTTVRKPDHARASSTACMTGHVPLYEQAQ